MCPTSGRRHVKQFNRSQLLMQYRRQNKSGDCKDLDGKQQSEVQPLDGVDVGLEANQDQ